MTKEVKKIFHRILLIVIFIFLVNAGTFLYRYNTNKGLTGFSIREAVSIAYTNLSPISKIFLIGQWFFLILALLIAFVKDKLPEEKLGYIDLKKMSQKYGTDIDTLYNLLKDKKQLRISSITKIFNVDKEVALWWCKTLEDANLAYIDYVSKNAIVKLNE